jgi:protein ATS1
MDVKIYALGSNGNGQLGIGTEADKVPKPSLVKGYPTATESSVSIRCGQNHTLIRSEYGTIYAAGLNTDRQLGYRPALNGIGTLPSVFPPDKLLSFDKRYEDIDFVAATATTTAYIVNPGNDHNPTGQAMIITEVCQLHACTLKCRYVI